MAIFLDVEPFHIALLTAFYKPRPV